MASLGAVSFAGAPVYSGAGASGFAAPKRRDRPPMQHENERHPAGRAAPDRVPGAPPTRAAETVLLLKIALPLIAAYLAEFAMFVTTKVVVGRLGYHEQEPGEASRLLPVWIVRAALGQGRGLALRLYSRPLIVRSIVLRTGPGRDS